MPRLTIFADDLTGALDASVRFAAPGVRVAVTWRQPSPPCDVLVLDTETRDLSGDAAARRLEALACLAKGRALKKIDSTLRGPYLHEAVALARSLRLKGVLLAPALPCCGRVVRRGRLYVHGRPVEETAFGRDPHAPVRCGDMLRRVTEAGLGPALHLDLATVRRGTEAVAAALAASTGVAVADAETEADLLAIAGAAARAEGWLPVGSAGLLAALADALGWPAVTAPAEPPPCPALYVCGSGHPVSRSQVRALAGACSVAPLVADGAGQCSSDAVGRSCEQAGMAIVTLPEERLDRERSVAALRDLVETAAAAIGSLPFASVFVTGGETLRELVEALAVTVLYPLAQPWPGVVVSQARAEDERRLWITSKAGGFGHERLLIEMAARTGRRREGGDG